MAKLLASFRKFTQTINRFFQMIITNKAYTRVIFFFKNLKQKTVSSRAWKLFLTALIKLKLLPWSRVFKPLLIVFLTIFLTSWATASWQVNYQLREDLFIKKVSKVLPIPIAYVGGNFIFASDYFLRLSMVDHFVTKSEQPVIDSRTEIRSEILDQTIFNESLRQLARKNDITISKQDINEEYALMTAELSEEDAKQQILDTYNVNIPEFKKLVGELALQNQVVSNKLANYQIAHIMVADEATANRVLERARAGEDFAKLASELSQDASTRDQGGDLNFADRDLVARHLGEDFAIVAFSIEEVGAVADKAAQSEYGFHVIKLLDKRGDVNKGLNQWVSEYQDSIVIKKFIRIN